MKNIIFKTLKFISSRLVYLLVGIFLAVSITCVYAAWNDAKTGGSGQLGQSNWNALVSEVHNKCGSNCDAAAIGATASGNALSENNWNNLVDLTNSTLVDCTNNNGGKCFINENSKSALDTNLTAGNIKSGVTIFGIAGTFTGATGSKANGVSCSSGSECISGYCYADVDNDGYGVATGAVCKASASLGTDCCDSDNGVHPGANSRTTQSACGGWDLDCSGAVEKNDLNCSDVTSCSGVGTCGLCSGFAYAQYSWTSTLKNCGEYFIQHCCNHSFATSGCSNFPSASCSGSGTSETRCDGATWKGVKSDVGVYGSEWLTCACK
ncbi:MAG: hypothetical protein WC619_00320 [Patescibacteria group bacterium]